MYQDIKDRLIEKRTLIRTLKEDTDILKKKEQELKECLDEITLHKLAYMQLDEIIHKSNEQYIGKIEKLLNKSIKTIFYDEDYAVKVVSDNKKLNFELIDNNNLDNKETPLQIDLDDACGGGVITVIGFTLQLFIIEVLNLNKIIFIDEGFMALSDKYRPLFYDFINEFCQNTGMKIMLVSHDETVKEKAVQEIEIEHGKEKVL